MPEPRSELEENSSASEQGSSLDRSAEDDTGDHQPGNAADDENINIDDDEVQIPRSLATPDLVIFLDQQLALLAQRINEAANNNQA